MSHARVIIALIVVVALGGASAAVVRQREHNKQVLRAMWADLHNVATAEEAHFADTHSYALDVTMNGFRPRWGAVVRIIRADATSWEATATYPGSAVVCHSNKVSGKTWGPPTCK